MLFSLLLTTDEGWLLNKTLVEDVICRLLAAYRQGTHLVIIDRRSADAALANLELGSQDRETIRRLRNEFTQTARLVDHAKYYIEVVSSKASMGVVKANALQVDFAEITRTRIVDRPVLLAESSSDGVLIRHLSQSLVRGFNLGSVSAELHHGGGDDICTPLEQLILDKRIIAVVYDSDRISPKSPRSAKSRRIEAKVGSFTWPHVYIEELPCHEIENVLPLGFAATIPQVYGATFVLLEAIEKRRKKDNDPPTEAFHLFYDHKRGLTVANLGRLDADARVWVEDHLVAVGTDPSTVDYPATGITITRALSEGRLETLHRELRDPAWQSVFGAMINRLCWIFVSARFRNT